MSLEIYLCVTNSDLKLFSETPRAKEEKKIFYSALTFYTITSLQLIAEGLNKQNKFTGIGERYQCLSHTCTWQFY